MTLQNATTPAPLFDYNALRHARTRAGRHRNTYGFLHDRVAREMAERLTMIRKDFPRALYSGVPLPEPLEQAIKQAGGIDTLINMDIVKHRSSTLTAREDSLPLGGDTLDAFISTLNLHSLNDLPGALAQINHALRPDGLFMAALFGGETLHELRACLMKAEMNVRGGVSPRIAPFVDKQQMGSLLQRAGFALPVIDSDILSVTYKDAFSLMRDLRFMGENNIITQRDKSFAGRPLFSETNSLYKNKFAEKDGRILATFEIIYLIGWAPHDSQQKPLCPGSAQVSLAEILKEQS